MEPEIGGQRGAAWCPWWRWPSARGPRAKVTIGGRADKHGVNDVEEAVVATCAFRGDTGVSAEGGVLRLRGAAAEGAGGVEGGRGRGVRVERAYKRSPAVRVQAVGAVLACAGRLPGPRQRGTAGGSGARCRAAKWARMVRWEKRSLPKVTSPLRLSFTGTPFAPRAFMRALGTVARQKVPACCTALVMVGAAIAARVAEQGGGEGDGPVHGLVPDSGDQRTQAHGGWGKGRDRRNQLGDEGVCEGAVELVRCGESEGAEGREQRERGDERGGGAGTERGGVTQGGARAERMRELLRALCGPRLGLGVREGEKGAQEARPGGERRDTRHLKAFTRRQHLRRFTFRPISASLACSRAIAECATAGLSARIVTSSA